MTIDSHASPPRDPFDAGWRERVGVLGGLGLALMIGFAFGMAFAPDRTLELIGLVPASFFAVGKFLPLWGISGRSNFGPYELGIVIWCMDTVSVVIIVYALEAFYRIRPVKRWLDKVNTNATLVLVAYPSIRRAALVGIVLFVLFPVAGTGAVGASFIGILLAMNRFVLIAAVSLGGCIGGLLIAYVSVHFGNALTAFQQMQQDPTIKYAFIAGIVLSAAGALYGLNRAYRRAIEHAAEVSGMHRVASGADGVE